MVGKNGTPFKKDFMRVQNNIILFALCLLLAGCASKQDPLFLDAQKSINRDYTMTELARISALVEIVKTSDDPNVKIQAINALRDLQQEKPKQIERSKYWFER